MIDTVKPAASEAEFSSAGVDDLAALFAEGETITVDAGVTLIEAGVLPQRALFLKSGLVRTSWSLSSYRSLLRGIVGAPGLIDATVLSPMSASSCCCVTVVRSTIQLVDAAQLSSWLVAHPHLALQLVRQVSATERLFVERLRQQQLMLPERLGDLLKSYLAAYVHAGHASDVELPLTNEGIAADLGVVARSVSAALGSLQRTGAAKRTMRGIVVERPDRLAGQASFFLGPGWSSQALSDVQTAPRHGSLTVVGDEAAPEQDIGNELRIGRAPECRLRLTGEAIAPRHCRVFRAATSDRYWIEDLKGNGSVLLNERPVTRAALSDGDTIRIGGYCILFHQADSARS